MIVVNPGDGRGTLNGKRGAPASHMPPSTTAAEESSNFDLLPMCRDWIRNNPTVSLALAITAGVALGWLIKRR